MIQMRNWILGAGLSFAGVCGADTFGFAWDNDLFVGLDKNYTNGLRISWVGDGHGKCDDNGGATCAVARALDPLPGVSAADERHALTVSLEQIMVTPDDIERSTPDYSDVPYVGYSNLELGLFSWDTHNLYGYGIRGGVVGPGSGAEESQKIVHKVTGSTRPRGWDNQLGPDLIGGVYFLHAHRFLKREYDSGYQLELGGAWGVDVNNFDGNAQSGGFIRFGRNLPGNFIPDYAGIGTAGSLVGLFDNPGFGWELFLGSSVQYNGYSYIERKGGDYNIDKEDWTVTLIGGAGVRNDRFSFTMTLQHSTSPIRDSDPISFGNMSFMWAI
ncbi:lipid A deacylase LpxR family protein [Alcanivoracaceae bacterium MT1]